MGADTTVQPGVVKKGVVPMSVMPKVAEYSDVSAYLSAIAEYAAEDDVRIRSDADRLHKENRGYIDSPSLVLEMVEAFYESVPQFLDLSLCNTDQGA